MNEIVKVIVPALSSIIVAIIGAQWFSPELFRLDLVFPSKEIKILDDFISVNFDFYEERGTGLPREYYLDEITDQNVGVFDRASYIEYVSIRRTTAKYEIRITSAELMPEIKAISPILKNTKKSLESANMRVKKAELDTDQESDNGQGSSNFNPKMIYVYRNGYQGTNSFGGKNIRYDTDRLTIVYNFSNLGDASKIFKVEPQACVKRSGETNETIIPVKWNKGVAIAELRKLKKDDIVRIYWTWAKKKANSADFGIMDCARIMRLST